MNSFIYAPPQNPRLKLLYRDHFLVVINKSSGLLSVPGRLPEHRDSALSRIWDFCPQAMAVHRLDMDTSGIMIFALCKEVARSLGIQFEKRLTRKIYLAEVHGTLPKEGDVDAPMRCDWEHRPLQIVDYELGKQALTHYRTVFNQQNSSLVMLFPRTGRSHQLRVHMAHLGHPIKGDRFYGDTQDTATLRLHASALAFNHPITHENLSFFDLPPFAKNYISLDSLKMALNN